jgi:hypothetical protein
MGRPLPSLLVAAFAACAGPPLEPGARAERAAPISAPVSAPGPTGTELEAFARPLGWPEDEAWVPLLLTQSQVTGSRRRLWFHKDAVTAGLLDHAGGSGFEAAPVIYPRGTVFFAEQLDQDGSAFDTEVLVTREGETPEFLLFDRDGARSHAEVPAACIDCHTGDAFFQPMMSFPTEPRAQRLEVDDTWRNVAITRHFLEAYHRGEGTFTPYAALWLSKLRADAASDRLTLQDRRRLLELRGDYAELLD